MSIRVNAHADRLFRTTGIPSSLNYTVAGFFQLVNDQDNYSALVSMEESSSSFQVLETDVDGTSLHDFIGFSPTIDHNAGVSLVPGTWYFGAVIHTATEIITWVVEVGSSSFIATSTSDTTARALAVMVLMGDSFNEPPDARACGWRVWDASDWTNGDLLVESQSLGPVRSSGLNAYYRWLTADEKLIDYGPNGYHLSEPGEGGMWETEENPPGIGTVTADLASTLPGLTSAMMASVGEQADLTSTLPGLTSSMDAAVGVAGSLAGVLPGLSSAMAISPGVAADIAGVLPGLTSDMLVVVAPVAMLASTLPGITSAMSLGHGPAAVLASILPGLTSAMEFSTTRHPSATMAMVDGPTASMGVV